MKKKRKFSKLALKFILGFILLGVLICGTSSVIGYNQFESSIQKQYNDTAYQVAEVAASYVEMDMLEEYARLVKGYREGSVTKEELDVHTSDPAYQRIREQLFDLRVGMGANDIFFVSWDWSQIEGFDGNMEGWAPALYIFDCYAVEEYSFLLGDSSPFNPQYFDEVVSVITEGVRPESYLISESAFGYNTSAQLPVKNEAGEVVAIVGVEIPMSTIQTSLQQYLLYAVLITVALIILFILVYVLYLYRKVINPIRMVADEAGVFINDRQVSEKLVKIKTKDEIQNLGETIHKMQVDINDYITNITAITAEKERIGAELDVAKHIQASMLPCIFPAFPDRKEIDIYATMDPAKEVGGDFYDFFMVDERHVAIVMADVSGKGVPAALFMVIGKTLIKDHTMPGRDLGEVFSEVNNLLCEANSEGLFITAFEGVLDLVTGEFNFVNAGHEMPCICKAGEDYEFHKIRAGFVLAGMEGMRYRAGSLTLNPGDKLFQYTDGVTEATNIHDELYGMERLKNILNSCKDKTPTETLPIVKADIDAFVGEAPQFDDITMLCLEYKERMEG